MSVFIDVPTAEPASPLPPSLSPARQSQNFFGTMYVGNNKVKVDGQNGRIIVNDDTGTPRIVIGNV